MCEDCEKCGVNCMECICKKRDPEFPEDKQAEVIFKFYSRDNKYDIWLTTNAWKFKSALDDIERVCRCMQKWPADGYSQETYDKLDDFAQKIKDLIPIMDYE